MNKLIILISLLFSINVFAIDQFLAIKKTIQYVQPKLSDTNAEVIANALLRQSREANVDWKIMAMIIAQESGFQQDPKIGKYSCLVREFDRPVVQKKTKHGIKSVILKLKPCIDYGIAQINYTTWSKELNLDKQRLLTDIDYNIAVMAEILSRLKSTYKKEKYWYTRYHSFTHSHRRIYADLLLHRFIKIQSYYVGFSDGYKSKKLNRKPTSLPLH